MEHISDMARKVADMLETACSTMRSLADLYEASEAENDKLRGMVGISLGVPLEDLTDTRTGHIPTSPSGGAS